MTIAAEVIRDSNSIRRKSAQMNKDLIMDVATKLFVEKSYESVSLDEIAKKIGATTGLIYYYFPSKADLLGELLLWNEHLFRQTMDKVWNMERLDAVERLKKIIKAHLDYNYERDSLITIEYRAASYIPIAMRRKIKKERDSYSEKFHSLVREVQDTGKLIKGDSEQIASCITSLANYMPHIQKNAGSAKRNALCELFFEMFIR